MNQRQMMNKRAFKNGFRPHEVGQIRATATKKAEEIYAQLKAECLEEMEVRREEFFLESMLIVVQTLAFDYWKKSSKKKYEKFIKECMSLYESWKCGAVSQEELERDFKEIVGCDLKELWEKQKGE